MKEFIEESVVYVMVTAIIYGALSLIALMNGAMDSSERKHDRWEGKIPCLEQPTNFEMLFPAYRLGCWLGAKQGEKYYWSKP